MSTGARLSGDSDTAGRVRFTQSSAFQNCNGLERNQQTCCGLLPLNMRDKHIKLYLFDAGRTGLFPSFCLLLGRLPGYPAAQGSPPIPTLDCGSGRRHYSVPRSARDRAGDRLRLNRKGLATKGSPIKSIRPQVSWWWRSVIDSDGRRSITVRRSPSVDRGQSRAVHRLADLICRLETGAPAHGG
jgi:hypothetical protein